MSAAVLGPGAPSFISSQPTAAAEAIAPRTATNRTQSGVHKYSLKGRKTVWGGGRGGNPFDTAPSLPTPTPMLNIQITAVPYGQGN